MRWLKLTRAWTFRWKRRRRKEKKRELSPSPAASLVARVNLIKLILEESSTGNEINHAGDYTRNCADAITSIMFLNVAPSDFEGWALRWKRYFAGIFSAKERRLYFLLALWGRSERKHNVRRTRRARDAKREKVRGHALASTRVRRTRSSFSIPSVSLEELSLARRFGAHRQLSSLRTCEVASSVLSSTPLRCVFIRINYQSNAAMDLNSSINRKIAVWGNI